VIPLEFIIDDAISTNGIKCMVTGSAQVKIHGTEAAIHLAAEQFLGKSVADIREIALRPLEGHTRAIIGTLHLEEINKKRKDFVKTVFEEVDPEYSNLGLKLLSFTLKDIKDPQGYLEALGKPKLAEAKKNAEIAEAETRKEAMIKAAEAKKEGDIAKIRAEAEISEANRDLQIKNAQFQSGINKEKASADFSYDLARFKVVQDIKKEEFAVKFIEKENEIKLEEKEILRKEKELDATVRKPAEAERYRIEVEAQGLMESKKLEGKTEAEVIKNRGEAEAHAMMKKAQAWTQYNEAAMLQMFFEVLPQLAKHVSEPLSRIEKIVLVNSGDGHGSGVSKITGDVASVMAQLPTVVQNLSEIDLKKLVSSLSLFKKNLSAENEEGALKEKENREDSKK
jgi:flotillin